MKDWKIIAASGTIAFLFSFISGLFGSVSLGVLFFRAVLGAIIFGVLGFGILILIRRFLPELFELKSGLTGESNEDFSNIENVQSVSTDAEEPTPEKQVIDISIGEEVENSEPVLNTENSTVQVDDDSNSNEIVDEIVESEKTEDSDQIPGNIDVLPDMGEFSNSFESAENIDSNNSSSAGAVTLDIMGEEQDPELVARAVRTMVKKDQEG
ncbi:MAG: hypothetical protein KAH95_03735 [Spirochaetales bacterium]|nr:hypothetical protein [Spirochaetales bacterium]